MNQVKDPIQKIRLVTVNWERPRDTIECVESALREGMNLTQILVVDNGSRDDSFARLRERFPGIQILSLSTNQGFAGGYNAGITAALEEKADKILLINNDAVLTPGTLSALLSAPWDIAVPKICYYDRSDLIWAAGSRWRAFPPGVVMRGYRKPDSQQYNFSMPLEFATGCTLLIERSVLERVPGFDPLFENYLEDYDFSYRVREAGFKIGYVPEARVLHKVASTLGETSPERWRYLGRNTVLFFLKGHRFRQGQLAAHLIWTSLRELIRGNFRGLQNYLAGVREGYRLAGPPGLAEDGS